VKLILPILILTGIFACTSQKKNNKSTEVKSLTMNEVGIGKDETAIIGTIQQADTTNKPLLVTILVEEFKQGGSGAPAIAAKTEVKVVFSDIFQRAYIEKNSEEVKLKLTVNSRVLVVVKRNLKSKEYQATSIIAK